jgi:hypothetical protein
MHEDTAQKQISFPGGCNRKKNETKRVVAALEVAVNGRDKLDWKQNNFQRTISWAG